MDERNTYFNAGDSNSFEPQPVMPGSTPEPAYQTAYVEGGYGSNDQADAVAAATAAAVAAEPANPYAGTVSADAAFGSSTLATSVAADDGGSAQGIPAEEIPEKGISIIAHDLTVFGDMTTEGHIDVIGKVRGNIAAEGDVAIHGQVRGNIDGEKIGLYDSRVRGNLKAEQGVIVNDTSVIDGDVSTKNVIFDGKVRGNIDAESVVVLRSHSYCLGDVTAASLAVEPGAVLNGTVRTLIEGDLEAPFEEIV
ncbi:MAG: polymer-forming cytoskeletal protein [Coriobacteriales bacterium]|jgi:cytoskeletal protein CcmA (bactofilin family)|nr:polymer-forming cytoskeletal protein [Coriobacteriales bacterium]